MGASLKSRRCDAYSLILVDLDLDQGQGQLWGFDIFLKGITPQDGVFSQVGTVESAQSITL